MHVTTQTPNGHGHITDGVNRVGILQPQDLQRQRIHSRRGSVADVLFRELCGLSAMEFLSPSVRILPLKSTCAPDPFLANAGRPILIDAQHAMAHHQVIIIDGETVIGGSFHDTKAAQEKHAENGEITRDEAVAAQYTANWQAHAQHNESYVGRGMAR